MGRVQAFVIFVAASALAAGTIGAAPARAATGSTVRVSVGTGGVQATGGRTGDAAAISADGRYVAFESKATNLVLPDTNGRTDIFVHDLRTGTTTLVSATPTGGVGNDESLRPSISRDGRFVAFFSFATDLVPGAPNGFGGIYVREIATSTTTLVSVSSSGAQPNWPPDFGTSISGDGRFVVWSSQATNLVSGEPATPIDPLFSPHHVFVRDLIHGATTRVSVNTAGEPADKGGLGPAVSYDGRFVTFLSAATNLSPGRDAFNEIPDVYIHDTQTGDTTPISVGFAGGLKNTRDFGSTPAPITPDGRYVAFASAASNLVPDDTNGAPDVFVRDRLGGVTRRASVSSSGAQGNFGSGGLAIGISDDGQVVGFDSIATNLVPDDSNNTLDVFLHDMGTGATTRVSVTNSGGQSSGGGEATPFSRFGSMTPDARIVAFPSNADNLVPDDTNNVFDVFVRILGDSNAPPTVSVPPTAAALAGVELSLSGSFADPDAGQTWSASATFGDGPGATVVALAAEKTFTVRHTYAAAGNFSLVVTVTDSAGGTGSGTTTVTVSADTTPPVTTATATPAANAAGWNNGDVTVTLSATDAGGSGVREIVLSATGAEPIAQATITTATASTVITTEGVTTLTFYARDNAGNAEAPQTLLVRIDRTKPRITSTRTPAANTAGWNNTDVTVSFSCADALSGLATCSAPTTLTAEGANQTVSGNARDTADNTQSLSVSGISIDKTPPHTSVVATPDPNGLGWNRTAVTVTLVAVDTLSRVELTEYSLDDAGFASYTGAITISQDGRHTLGFRSTDKAGNSEATQTVKFRIDTTAPEADISFDPATQDLRVLGRDLVSGVVGGPIAPTVTPAASHGDDEDNDKAKSRDDGKDEDRDHDRAAQRRTYRIADGAGNTLVLVVDVRPEGHELNARVVSLQYAEAATAPVARNRLELEWSLTGTRVRELEQQIELGRGEARSETKAHFDVKKDETRIQVEGPKPERKLTRPGLVLLHVVTDRGQLRIEF